MLALKIILYYLACFCMVMPLLSGLFHTNETKAERDYKGNYPWKLMRTVFIAGLVFLIIAVALTIYC